MNSMEVRSDLVRALRLDLVGPAAADPEAREILPQAPSRWYLTGFLIPAGTPPEKRADVDEDEEIELVPESAGLAEESNDERRAAKKAHFPSSMGLSFLVARDARELAVVVRWGEYAPGEIEGKDGKPLFCPHDIVHQRNAYFRAFGEEMPWFDKMDTKTPEGLAQWQKVIEFRNGLCTDKPHAPQVLLATFHG